MLREEAPPAPELFFHRPEFVVFLSTRIRSLGYISLGLAACKTRQRSFLSQASRKGPPDEGLRELQIILDNSISAAKKAQAA